MGLILIYILIATFIAWIWVDYFRLIDIFNKDDFSHLIFIFLFGAASTLPVLALEDLNIQYIGWDMNRGFINDLLYCIFKVGMVEEIAKALPILITYKFFKNRLKEPIDILAFFSVSALGFSAAENVMYFKHGGHEIIIGRAVLSSVAHMFNTALVSYGLIRILYYHGNKKYYLLFVYLLLASISHGIYDFLILFYRTSLSILGVVFYFLLTVSVFATILNNCINNSSYFTYSLVIDSDKVSYRMFKYYGIVYLMQLSLIWYREGFLYALINNIFNLMTVGFILVITITRLSRFKLIKDRWNTIKLEMPMTYESRQGLPGDSKYIMKIRGESYNEVHINAYYNNFCILSPVSRHYNYLDEPKIAFIEEKLFLKNDETFYLLKVFNDFENNLYFKILIKPKTTGNNMSALKHPIVALLEFEDNQDLSDNNLSLSDFSFMEWAYIKPRQDFD